MRLKLPVVTDAGAYSSYFNDDVWREAAASICARHHLLHSSLVRLPQGENIIFSVDERFVIKIFAPFRNCYERERVALEFVDGRLSVETPAILHAGEIEGWSYLVMTQLSGLPAKELWPQMEGSERMEIASALGAALKGLHNLKAPLSQPGLDWQSFVEHQARTCLERQRACGANPEWLKSLPDFIETRLRLLPAGAEPVFLHGDVHAGNLLLSREQGRWKISGVFDFGDSLCGLHEYEFVAPGVLMLQGSRELQREFLLAYGYEESALDDSLRARLMLLTVLYECSDLRKYALRLAPEAVHLTLDELEAAIWRFAAT
jgi:hygromycin-B 7''-O-kinase